MTEEKIFNRNQLKYIAALAMLIDHIGMMFILFFTPVGMACRIIGRITAPIMCFFIAEGYFYTRSKKNYGIRLFIFAVISQFAYSFVHVQKLFTFDLSVIYTFFICFLVLVSYEYINNKILKFLAISALIFVSFWGDWGVIAPLWVLVFWIYRDSNRKKIIGYLVVVMILLAYSIYFSIQRGFHWYGGLWQMGSLLCLPLLLNYNGKKGSEKAFDKWFFYIFYPMHLVILGLIKFYLI